MATILEQREYIIVPFRHQKTKDKFTKGHSKPIVLRYCLLITLKHEVQNNHQPYVRLCNLYTNLLRAKATLLMA